MLQQSDIQNGNVLNGPDGEVRVSARLLTDQGTYLILQPETGLAGLISEGHILDHPDYSLHTSIAANGNGSVEDQSIAAAQRSEVDRLSKMVEALLAERQANQTAPAPADTSDPAAVPGQDVITPGSEAPTTPTDPTPPPTGPPAPGPQGPQEV